MRSGRSVGGVDPTCCGSIGSGLRERFGRMYVELERDGPRGTDDDAGDRPCLTSKQSANYTYICTHNVLTQKSWYLCRGRDLYPKIEWLRMEDSLVRASFLGADGRPRDKMRSNDKHSLNQPFTP